MKNGISVYSDLNRLKNNFRLISCTLMKEFSQIWMHNKYTQPFRTRCQDPGYSGILSKDLGLNLHGASKPKKHSLLSKYLLSNPGLPLLFLLFKYTFTSLKEKILQEANNVNRKRKRPHPQKNKEIRRKKVIKRGLPIPNEYQQTKYHSTNRR